MTDTVILNAELRETGSKNAAKVRAKGLLPAVIYGHKLSPESVTVEYRALISGLHAGHRLFNLKFDGQSAIVLVKEIQYDHLGKDILHIDFMRVSLDEKALVSVPVVFRGTAKGTEEGGVLGMYLDQIEINCPVTMIPEAFVVMVKPLGIGDAVYAKDIAIPNGAELITDPEIMIANCYVAAEQPEIDEDLEEIAEPEVITERQKDDEEQE